MKIKSILVSQPKPADLEKSPYTKLADKHKLTVDYFKFIKIEGIPSKDFRKARTNVADYSAVIFTSRQAVDHFFRIAKELRIEVAEDLKYFCMSESTAYYLQNYVQFRKRRIFHGERTFHDLMTIIKKHPDENYLFPCSETHKQDLPDALTKEGITYTKAVIYKTAACDLSKIAVKEYDMLVFFSPSGIKSLMKNFPDYEQGEQIIATFGKTTTATAKDFGLKVKIEAPTPKAPSMSMAIENYVKESNKRKR
ncbi:MAG: uroporphyrinogen-III synthase [Bacteroidetes bacterium 4572_112]|nr:MAG: uroporphyrinogen-III synthase [Bacteroidetes bacterium 4572_112]